MKPITGNREIEKIPDASFTKENMPFSFYKAEEVVKHINNSQIENHLLEIYNYLSKIFNFFELIKVFHKAQEVVIN